MHQTLDKISTKILRTIPFVLSFLVPLFFLPLTTDYFAFNKYFLVAVLGSISLIAWCVRNLVRGKMQFTSSPALLPLIILVIANIVSSVWLSPTKHVSLFGQTSLFFFLAIIFITTTSSQKNRFIVGSTITGLIASASFLSLFTLLHYFGLTAKITAISTFTSKYFNPTGSILPAISFVIPILVATVFYTTTVKNWTKRSFLFASVLLMIIGTIINISLILPQNGTPTISILPFAAGWSIAVDTMKTWQTALLGTGPETYFTAFTRLRPAYLNLTNNIWNLRFSESSNFIFTLITTTGLLGSLAFVFTFLRPLFTTLKNKDRFEEKSSVNFLLIALIITCLSYIAIPTGIVSLVLGFVLLIALTVEFKLNSLKDTKDVNLSLAATNTPAAPEYRDLPQSTTVSTSFIPWFILICSLGLLSVYWVFAGKMYAASMSYNQATNVLQMDAYSAFLSYQKAAELDPYNPYYQQKLSQIYLTVSKAYLTKKDATTEEKTAGTDFAQRALDAGKKAALLDPFNVTSWENLFTTYRDLISYADGAANMALSHGLQAASLDPTNPTLYLQIGTLLYNLGDTDQAITYINRASELKQNWNLPYLNLSSIYEIKKDYTRALQYAKAALQYTAADSTDLNTIQEEVNSLQKLVPNTQSATSSATVQP